MISRIHRRRSILGQSFTTCLLIVVLFFGGIGTYYFKVFRFRDVEDPKRDQLIVAKTDPSELAFFRKKTNPDVIDPINQQYAAIVALRKSTKNATVKPDNYDQTVKQIINRCIDIMDVAKLRQIPKQYAKKYENVLIGIGEVYQSMRALEEAMDAEIPADKERAFQRSKDLGRSSQKRLKVARDFFYTR